ncbi:MAG: hypothetical protein R3F17_02635 [Planctomycetota bacterium]
MRDQTPALIPASEALRPMAKDIPESRKIAYYSGGALMILGIVLFLSVFLGGGPDTTNFRDFEKESDSMARRAMIGMVFIGVGAIIRNIAQRGLAGSGMVLDPEQARKDLEPFSRQTGEWQRTR